MTWFAWQGYNDGKAVDIAGIQEKQAVSLGFHGYATETQAEAHPNIVANWSADPIQDAIAAGQKEFVNGIIRDYGFAKKAGEQPGGPNANILNPVNDVKGDISYVGNTIPGLAQIGQFFSDLTQRNTWLRVAKIAAGFVLVVVGVLHLVNAGNIVTAAARTVPV